MSTLSLSRSQHLTYTKWERRVKNMRTPWAENEIIYFRKYINNWEYKNAVSSISLPSKHPLLVEFEKRALKGRGYKITSEQTAKGLSYISSLVFRKDGTLRQSKENFLRHELGGILVLRKFREFRLVALVNTSYRGGFNNYVPVYRVYSDNNSYFDYTGVHKSQIEVRGGGIYK